jgi:hypothetical protein
MYTEISACRVCAGTDLTSVLSLGEQYLTGVFPTSPDEEITRGPLELVWCSGCGLLQMRQSYSLEEMYGDNYGYRSGLNGSMVRHLQQKVRFLERLAKPTDADLVIDIGSNDATSLKAYSGKHRKVGIDPTGAKFRDFYAGDMALIPDFFSAAAFEKEFPGEKAKIVTSIAMFYDLERPVDFVRDIARVLANDGIWHFEQSYMPSMLRSNAYDTICHEHLEFYSFRVVTDILARAGMRVIDVQMNAVNGGSFAVTACKMGSRYKPNRPVIDWMLRQETQMGLNTIAPYKDFERRVYEHRESLRDLIESLVADGKRIVGYGASTKGNVLLQFCGLTTKHIECIAEVNADKFGSYTPGTLIPIVSEQQARALNPDYFLVLPWHFKNSILEREKEYLANGGKFIFPMPEIEII